MISKKEIRSVVLEIRKSFNEEYLKKLSSVICNRVINQEAYDTSSQIVLYMPYNNEVDVKPIINDALSKEKKVWLPKIIDKVMEFYLYEGETRLAPGKYGILEPQSNEKLIPDKDTLIIMPGVAFSEDKGRVGYGGGYYDRYLSTYPCCKTIAVCYNFQIMPFIPMDDYDIRPDMVISDSNIFK